MDLLASVKPAAVFTTVLCLAGTPLLAQEEVTAAERRSRDETAPAAETASPLPDRIVPTDYLLLPRVGNYQRAPLHVDPLEAAIARGDWSAPAAGDRVVAADGEPRAWTVAAEAGPSAEFRGGYAYAEFESPAEGVMLIEAAGCASVWLNGEWIVGDPYGVGWFRPPVAVVEGKNRLLLHLANPAARATLVEAVDGVRLLAEQATLPDVLIGDSAPLHASLPLVNATNQPLADLELVAGAAEPIALPWIAPRMITPVVFTVPPLAAGEPGEHAFNVVIRPRRKAGGDGDEALDRTPEAIAATTLKVRVVAPETPHTRTHLSSVDNSVQPYAVLPASVVDEGLPASAVDETSQPGVLLVLHDAGETHREAIARCEPLADAHLVAPSGRGRFGFDWEDWSATDALEALDDFLRRTPADKARVAVTGRGMGGHGALHLATRAPSRLAAIAPTGAWLSFYTQGRARALPPDATRVERALAVRTAAADPLRVLENLAGLGVYVAHAPDDPIVAPAESRLLRNRLSDFHTDFAYRESADAGRVAPGAPLVEFCRSRAAREAGDRVIFATPDPGALSGVGWARIEAQANPGAVSRINLRRDKTARRVAGSTENVRRLALSIDGFEKNKPVTVVLDGQPSVRVEWPGRTDTIRLQRSAGGRWRRARSTSQRTALKTPERPGGLKSVFANRPLLVYGTRGGAEAKRWSEAKARYDAMLFLYRGAGRLDLTPDSRVNLRDDPSRNIVLYGASHTNRAYRFLMQTSPAWVDEGVFEIGPRPEVGDDLATLIVRPRWNSGRATVAVIGGTGPTGMRLTTKARYFWSGIAYPDVLVYGPGAISSSVDPSRVDPRFAGDVRVVGEFGEDWSAESGGIVWRDVAL